MYINLTKIRHKEKMFIKSFTVVTYRNVVELSCFFFFFLSQFHDVFPHQRVSLCRPPFRDQKIQSILLIFNFDITGSTVFFFFYSPSKQFKEIIQSCGRQVQHTYTTWTLNIYISVTFVSISYRQKCNKFIQY